jgi:hypothetical protein
MFKKKEEENPDTWIEKVITKPSKNYTQGAKNHFKTWKKKLHRSQGH